MTTSNSSTPRKRATTSGQPSRFHRYAAKPHYLMAAFLLLGGCVSTSYKLPDLPKSEINAARAEIERTAQPTSRTTRISAFENDVREAYDRLVPHAQRICYEIAKTNGCRWSLDLEYSEDEVNASAFHGRDGYDQRIAIYKGVYDFSRNQDELAFVVAHEIAHHLGDHIDKSKRNSLVTGLTGIAVFAAVALSGDNPYVPTDEEMEAVTMASMLAGQLVFSAEMESEADYLAVYMMAAAGYDPEAVRTMVLRMSALQSNIGKTGMFSSHPAGPERLARAAGAIAEVGASSARIPPHLLSGR